MQYTFSEKDLNRGVQFFAVKAPAFKTAAVSVSLSVPLGEDASVFALVPFILTRASRDYPDVTALEKHLAKLYGAEIGADVTKLGENQIIKLSVSCIADRFSLDKKPIVADCCRLLCSLLFHPHFRDGVFLSDETESEKRLLLEQLGAEMSDKRAYAKNRCEEIMCGEEAYGIHRFGTREDIRAITPESLTEGYHRLLRTAKAVVTVSADEGTDFDSVQAMFRDAFGTLEREPLSEETLFVEEACDVTYEKEESPVKQGKLVMGFRAGMADATDSYAARRVMTELFGGGPQSKLFSVVREKMSLCYYCSARLIRHKGILLVQSGIETEKEEEAKEGILAQLTAIQKGEFTDEELSATQKALADGFRSVSDSPEALEAWFSSQLADPVRLMPEDYIRAFSEVTREEVQKVAGEVTLDTVFMLAGTSGEEA